MPLVIGIGNSMRRDDGVGPAVVDRLTGTPGVDLTVLDGEATRLVEAWRSRDHVVIVDAARRGDPAGTLHRLDLAVDRIPVGAHPASSHAAGLADALELGRALDCLPAALVVYGVEAEDLSFGEGLSPAVRKALDNVVDRVRAEVADR